MAQTAYFAAGCFWGVQAEFDSVAGVLETEVGYMGGTTPNPTYEEVCGGASEHAEAVKVVFDETRLSYAQLLDFFWTCHNPAQLNRQGFDIGRQYRTAIFCNNDAQFTAATASKTALQTLGKKIATEITAPPATAFFRGEEYHQNYFAKNRKGA